MTLSVNPNKIQNYQAFNARFSGVQANPGIQSVRFGAEDDKFQNSAAPAPQKEGLVKRLWNSAVSFVTDFFTETIPNWLEWLKGLLGFGKPDAEAQPADVAPAKAKPEAPKETNPRLPQVPEGSRRLKANYNTKEDGIPFQFDFDTVKNRLKTAATHLPQKPYSDTQINAAAAEVLEFINLLNEGTFKNDVLESVGIRFDTLEEQLVNLSANNEDGFNIENGKAMLALFIDDEPTPATVDGKTDKPPASQDAAKTDKKADTTDDKSTGAKKTPKTPRQSKKAVASGDKPNSTRKAVATGDKSTGANEVAITNNKSAVVDDESNGANPPKKQALPPREYAKNLATVAGDKYTEEELVTIAKSFLHDVATTATSGETDAKIGKTDVTYQDYLDDNYAKILEAFAPKVEQQEQPQQQKES